MAGWWKGAGVALWALLVLAGVAACGGDDDGGNGEGDTGAIRVVASTTILADWVRQAGGDEVEVTSIVPENTDVHGFLITPAEIRDLRDADLVVLAGGGIEAPFEADVRANASGQVLALADGLELQPLGEALVHDDDAESEDEHEHEDGLDPHIWMDVDLAIASVDQIAGALSELRPGREDYFRENAETYAGLLRTVDIELEQQLADLPENRRYLVTFHDAYGYFAERYGLTLLGFIVESPEEQPAAGELAELISEIEAHDVEYIFTEPQFSSNAIDQLAADTGTEVRALPSDALTDEYPDYVSFLRTIAERIAS